MNHKNYNKHNKKRKVINRLTAHSNLYIT